MSQEHGCKLQADRFGLFRIERFASVKECHIIGDYPPCCGYEAMGPTREILQVDILVVYGLKQLKDMDKEFGSEIPMEILETPVHAITYFIERSQLDRLLAYANYGMFPSAKVTVEQINPAENIPENKPIREWFAADALGGREESLDLAPAAHRDEALAKLDNFLTFCNSIFFSLRTQFMAFEHMSDFYKCCYEYFVEMIDGRYNVDFGYNHFSELVSGLQELRDFNLKNPNSPIMPDAEWFYSFFGREVLGLKNIHGFACLMAMREKILYAYDVLDHPLSKHFETHGKKGKKFSSKIFDMFPMDARNRTQQKDQNSELNSIDEWVDTKMLPLFEASTIEIDLKLQMELESINLIKV